MNPADGCSTRGAAACGAAVGVRAAALHGGWRREGAVDDPTADDARALGEALGREIRAEAGDRLAWT